jgi:peptide/nickel transport system permease protein
VLFRWNGIGQLLYNAATHKDFSMLEAGVIVIGAAYMIVTLLADILYSLLNPRIRYRSAE